MSGRMVIRNGSRYDAAEVRALIKFAIAELDMRGVCINVRNTEKGWAGMAYDGVPFVSNAPPEARYLITLRIGKAEYFPMHRPRLRSGEPDPGDYEDWREALVFLAAHEAKHVDQFQHGTSRSEVACNNFATYMLRRYREEKA